MLLARRMFEAKADCSMDARQPAFFLSAIPEDLLIRYTNRYPPLLPR
jgi:hypothetical protein